MFLDGRLLKETFDCRLIESASRNLTKLPAAILFDEWGTSGKVRPTLSHLLKLLIKLELFQAADYVAVKLLKEAAPQRPSTGPAAKIDISLPEDDDSGVTSILNDMSYPPTNIIINEVNRPDINKDFYEKRGPIDKQTLNPLANATTSAQPPTTSDNASSRSALHDTDFLPPISVLLETYTSSTHNRISTDSSQSDSSHESAPADQQSSRNSMNNIDESFNIPQISALASDSSNLQISSFNIPNISRLQNSTSDSLLNDDHSAHIITNNTESSAITDSSQSESNLPIFLDSSNCSDEGRDDNIPNISILRL